MGDDVEIPMREFPDLSKLKAAPFGRLPLPPEGEAAFPYPKLTDGKLPIETVRERIVAARKRLAQAEAKVIKEHEIIADFQESCPHPETEMETIASKFSSGAAYRCNVCGQLWIKRS